MTDAHFSRLDLNLLRVLDVLLREENVTRAAKRLRLTQPAVSRALARLREALGDPLFVRTRHGVVATPRAKALKEPLAQALGQLGALVEQREVFEPATARGRFVLGMTDLTQAVLLPALMEYLARNAPGVDLTVRPLPPELERELASGGMDVAIGPPGGDLPDLKRRVLFKESFLCLVREGHPVLAPGAWDLDAYVRLPHLFVTLRERAGEGPVGEVLARKGLSRRLGLVVPTFMAAPAVIARTDLVFTAPARLVRQMGAQHALRTLKPPLPLPSFDMAMLWHASRDDDPAHRWLRGAVVEASRGQ
jgi:DNA-binding transcriptional LysR family regulator